MLTSLPRYRLANCKVDRDRGHGCRAEQAWVAFGLWSELGRKCGVIRMICDRYEVALSIIKVRLEHRSRLPFVALSRCKRYCTLLQCHVPY